MARIVEASGGFESNPVRLRIAIDCPDKWTLHVESVEVVEGSDEMRRQADRLRALMRKGQTFAEIASGASVFHQFMRVIDKAARDVLRSAPG